MSRECFLNFLFDFLFLKIKSFLPPKSGILTKKEEEEEKKEKEKEEEKEKKIFSEK